MKISNKGIDADASKKEKTSVTVIRITNNNKVLITILPLLSMIVASLLGMINKTSSIDIAKIGILTLVLTGAATFYIRLNADSILNRKLAKTIICLGYLVSIVLLLLVPEPEIFSFWMIGGLLVAMLIDSKLGLLLHFNLSFILGISLPLHPETVIQILIMGVIMSLLAGSLRQKSTAIYSAIIILSTNITLAFAINNFIFETKSNFNYMNSLFSILAVLVTAFLICTIYDSVADKKVMDLLTEDSSDNLSINPSEGMSKFSFPQGNASDVKVSMQEVTTTSNMEQGINADIILQEAKKSDENFDILHNLGTRTSYEVLCDFDNELIKKMKQHSESLYSHCVHIGDLSYRAAVAIGANELLALAGGLYHEIGKINGKNYIEEGLIIAEDYAFPKELKAILKEHNIKYEKPSSVEAAIVMLSDNVVSTIEYIEKTEEHKFTTNKIIDNIFQMRMDKGTFDASSLSLKDFKKLKEFYQNEFSK